MTSKEHRKHGKTVKAKFGEFGRMEIAIMGTPCGEIKRIAESLIEKLKDFRIAYIDADHKTEEEHVPRHVHAGAQLSYTDKIKFHRVDHIGRFDRFERNRIFNEFDLVLVNGNHFEADMQILVIDDRKPLEKKLDRIKKPLAILRQSSEQRLPDYLEKHLGKELEIQPMYSIDELDRLANLTKDTLILNVPPLNGLVLAGGKSQRMGEDKGLIDYHGMPQRDYIYRLLSQVTEKTFMSIRPDQKEEFGEEVNVIPDSITGLGPFGALISAFREDPNHAWLVVACDLPMLDRQSIGQLIEGRNPSKINTNEL